MEQAKPRSVWKLLCALNLCLVLGAALFWYRDVYLRWADNPLFVPSFILVNVLLFAQIVLLTLLALKARGETKLAGKTVLSAVVFEASLAGVSAVINNAIGKGGLNKQASCVAITLAAAQAVVLLFLFLRAAGWVNKRLGAALLCACLAVTALGGALGMPKALVKDEPFQALDIFDNSVADSIPQWKIHDIILSHFEKERTDGRQPKCLLVGFDGCRSDALANIVEGESGIMALRADGGGLYNAYTGGDGELTQHTSTDPGWTTMLTGKWAREEGGGGHGVENNGDPKALEPKTVFTQILELEPPVASRVSFASSWDGHFNTSFKSDRDYCARKGFDINWDKVPNDAKMFDDSKKAVADGYDMVMLILEYCDHAGHATGFSNKNPDYVKAFRQADREALALINEAKARATYAQEDWLILISTDHGGSSTSHGSQQEACRQIWLAVSEKLPWCD